MKSYFILIILGLFFIGCKKEENNFLVKNINKIEGNQGLSIYPHSTEFKYTTQHGAKFLENKANCTQCHGEDFAGGTSQVSCQKCHNYPHEKNWANPNAHGEVFNQISKRQVEQKDPTKKDFSECMMCHDNNPDAAGKFKERHPKKFVSCSSCHADLPHGKKFLPTEISDTGPISHSKYTSRHKNQIGSCYSCHLNDHREAPKPVDSCLNCHEGPPFEEAKE